MQVLMLLRRRLAAIHSARGHIVDEVMMSRGQPMFLALKEERNFAPLKRTVGVAKGPGAVLFALCPHARLLRNRR